MNINHECFSLVDSLQTKSGRCNPNLGVCACFEVNNIIIFAIYAVLRIINNHTNVHDLNVTVILNLFYHKTPTMNV